MSEKERFVLKSTNADFTVRQKNVFDQLLALETNRNRTTSRNETQMEVEVDDNTVSSNPGRQRAITKKLRGKESIFKRPQNPVPKNYINKIPDFKKHPHKWTRYTLDDVNDEQMSDKSNTKTALSFLEELKERKHNDNLSLKDDKVDLSRKIIFKKHKSHEAEVTVPEAQKHCETLNTGFKGSKMIMPEYVVGQKVKKDKRRKCVTRGKELMLDHLYENE